MATWFIKKKNYLEIVNDNYFREINFKKIKSKI